MFGQAGLTQLSTAINYQPDDVARINQVKALLDQNFSQNAGDLPGIRNATDEREAIKTFYLDTIDKLQQGTLEVATPGNNYGLLTGDLVALSGAWAVLDRFAPELMVVNTTTIVPMICGTLILKKIWNGLAPSIIAASMVSSGMPRKAADRITMAKPVWIQIRMNIRKKLFQNGICSGSTGSAPNRKLRRALSRPIFGSTA